MDFHRWQRAEVSREVLGAEVLRLFRRFSAQELGGYGGHGNRSLAAKGLERRAVDHAFTVLFGEFQPHPQHIAALGGADGADGICVLDFPLVLGIRERFFHFVFKRTHDQWCRNHRRMRAGGE